MLDPIQRSSGQRAVRLVLLFFFISFAGWCGETVYFGIRYGVLADRGFLTSPLCPIYGFCLLGMAVGPGAPQTGLLQPLFIRAKGSRFPKAAAAGVYLLYFMIAALLPTAVEFVTAAFFDRALGIRLWDYSYKRFDLFGYVSLDQAILWGLLITLAMQFVWPWLWQSSARIPAHAARIAALLLLAWTACDLLFNALWLAVTGRQLLLFRS